MPVNPEADALAQLRETYTLGGLDESDLDPDPLTMLRRWTGDAVAANLHDPTAMVLSTVSADGLPSSRTVLCKGIFETGLRFYTNRTSAKAADLDATGVCALLFPWHPLQRQARVEGRVVAAPDAESDAYFASRPRESQLGAWASHQSRPVGSRADLDAAYAEAERRFTGVDVPRPDFWGGYDVVPDRVELWQGREGRLHDRLSYRRTTGGWVVERLAP